MMNQAKNTTPGSALLLSHDDADSPDSLQLSKLSSVLNGLEFGAQLMQQRVAETLSAIRAGTYRVDPLQLSRRIVGEALRLI